MVQPYFHLKSGCKVNNNKYIPDKALFAETNVRAVVPYVHCPAARGSPLIKNRISVFLLPPIPPCILDVALDKDVVEAILGFDEDRLI